jgi:Protein O-mannosyl-transferase TMEM260-like
MSRTPARRGHALLSALAARVGRHDWVIAGGLALMTLCSRWPFRARMLYNWDAVQFALALREFDVAKHQPHPPGYLFYVGLAQALNLTLADPTLAYVALSMLFSAATTFTVYWLGRAIYGRLTAAAAAALLAVSPLFWFYGSVGLTYAGEAFATSLVALLAWRTLGGSVRYLYMSAVALGLAGGLRLSVLVLMLPLWAVSAIVGIRSAQPIRIACAFLAGSVLLWLAPMVWLSGGLGVYVSASAWLYRLMIVPTSVARLAPEVTLAQTRYVLESVVVGLGPLTLAFLVLPHYARRRGWGRPEWFLVGWMLPAVAFYTLVHFGQAGYVLSFLPALVILLSRALVELVSAGSESLRLPHWRQAMTVAALIPLVMVNTGFFVSARPERRDFDSRRSEAWLDAWAWKARDELHDWVMSRTAAALRQHEAVIRTYVESIRGLYDPSDTALLTERGNSRSYPWLRHAMYYMPEYAVYQLGLGDQPGFYAPQSAVAMFFTPLRVVTVPGRIKQLVWFVDHWDPTLERPDGLQEVSLAYGRFLYVLPLRDDPVEHAGYTFVREHP